MIKIIGKLLKTRTRIYDRIENSSSDLCNGLTKQGDVNNFNNNQITSKK